MTTIATEMLLQNIQQSHLSPNSVNQVVLNILDTLIDGNFDIVDATNPWSFLLEASATGVAAAIAEGEILVRKIYPELALDESDLFPHLSDNDYAGIFSAPAAGKVELLIPYAVLEDKAIKLNAASGVQYLIIPQHSTLTVGGYDLGIIHEIRVNLLDNNVIQVFYGSVENNPLFKVDTNILSYQLINLQKVTYLQITIPVLQYSVFSNIFNVGTTAGFSAQISFIDNFYHVRAFIANPTTPSEWVECSVTHSDNYDINVPTVRVSVINQILTVTVPDIYQTTHQLTGLLRVDVFSTKGELEIDMAQFNPSSSIAIWKNYDTFNNDPGLNVLSSINDTLIYSSSMLSGGRKKLTFKEIKDRVVYHKDGNRVPILPTDISIALEEMGYTYLPLIDSVSDRVLLTVKGLPTRKENGLVTSISALNTSVFLNSEYGTETGLYKKSITTHPNNRLTIKPDAIFEVTSTGVVFLSDSQITALNALPIDDYIANINVKKYFCTPFFFIIDITNMNRPTGAAYHLAAPSIVGRNFIDANPKRNYNVYTIDTNIILVGNVYRFVIQSSRPANLNDIKCQITYRDKNSGTYLHLEGIGVMAGPVANFTFDLETNFNITPEGEIEILNLRNAIGVVSPIYINLDSLINVFYYLAGDNATLETSFDNSFYPFSPAIGMTYETLSIGFGSQLDGLYCPLKETLVAKNYLTYTENVPALYSEDIYETNSTGKVYVIELDGTVTFTKLHLAGDPILDGAGDPVIEHFAGSPILDINGQHIPDPASEHSTGWIIGLTMFDYRYYASTVLSIKEYVNKIPAFITGYLSTELKPLRQTLSARTQLFYRPHSEQLTIQIKNANNEKQIVSAILDIIIVYYVDKAILSETDIVEKIKNLTRETLSDFITRDEIAVSELITVLSNKTSRYTHGLSVDKFLPNNTQRLTILDGNRFTIGKQVVQLPDTSLGLEDTVDILFKVAQSK